MGSISALKLTRVLDNVARVVAVELLCGAQAIDFHKPLSPGKGTAAAYEKVRAAVPFIRQDTSLTPHIAALEAMTNSGEILVAVEQMVGPLLSRGK
jgi:histidine ammonia-lyase